MLTVLWQPGDTRIYLFFFKAYVDSYQLKTGERYKILILHGVF